MNKTFAKMTLAAALMVGGAMTAAQAGPWGHDRDDGWHHRPHHEISRGCAEHPRACAARHAERAERRAYRHRRHEIREYRRAHHWRHRHHYRDHDRYVRVIPVFPNQFGVYLSIR